MRRRTYLQTVAASGAAVVGVGADVPGSPVQSAHAQTDSGWTQQATLTADDGDFSDKFGWSVVLDGGRALIGARNEVAHDRLGAGSAYVFEHAGGEWTQVARVVGEEDDGGDSNDLLGASVALDGERALVGANGDEDPNGIRAGSAYVFEPSNGAWTQQAKLTPDDGDADDNFGTSVALDGDTALVGASTDEDPGGQRAGSAYVFEHSDGAWTQITKLVPDGDGGLFGTSVALDGDTALVGASSDGIQGSAYVFTRRNGEWSQVTRLSPDDDDGDGFGISVALAEHRALVGARGADPIDEPTGSAYVFERTDGGWSQTAKLTADNDDTDDWFGRSIALDGDTALIGAPRDEDPNGPRSGSAYLFQKDGEEWIQERKFTPDDGDEGDQFGLSLTLDGGSALVGSPFNDDPNGGRGGSVYVFGLGSEESDASTPPDVTRDGNPATDPDGDGLYEDVNGDGDATPGDATVLFDSVFEGDTTVTDNVSLFDFSGDGSLTPGDATVLFNEIF